MTAAQAIKKQASWEDIVKPSNVALYEFLAKKLSHEDYTKACELVRSQNSKIIEWTLST